MNKALEVELRNGKLYHEGKPVKAKGKFYLIGEDTLKVLRELVRKRNSTVEEDSHEIPEELREQLPPWIKVNNEFVYYLDPSMGVLKGRFLWVRYKTLEEELDELPKEKGDKDE